VPITTFQKHVFQILKSTRNPESYVAGGTAINRSPDSMRYSNDIDFFHDTEESVSKSFELDRKALENNGYKFDVLISQPSFHRAVITKNHESLKLEWVRDTAFRFFPVEQDDELGYKLHDIDLAVNKCIALANRAEARDLIDIIQIHKKVLSLASCCWAACGKDPGFTPSLILEMIQRHSIITKDMLENELLHDDVDPILLKKEFVKIFSETEHILSNMNPTDIGCIYINAKGDPLKDLKNISAMTKKHYGSVKGSWPRIVK
jgi:hypothetical protein